MEFLNVILQIWSSSTREMARKWFSEMAWAMEQILYIRLGMNFYLVAIWYSLILLFRNGRPLLEQRENKGILYFYYSETVVLYSRKERIKEFFIFTIQKRSAIL